MAAAAAAAGLIAATSRHRAARLGIRSSSDNTTATSVWYHILPVVIIIENYKNMP